MNTTTERGVRDITKELKCYNGNVYGHQRKKCNNHIHDYFVYHRSLPLNNADTPGSNNPDIHVHWNDADTNCMADNDIIVINDSDGNTLDTITGFIQVNWFHLTYDKQPCVCHNEWEIEVRRTSVMIKDVIFTVQRKRIL